MRGSGWKTLILTGVSTGILLAGGGCMMLPHPGHDSSKEGHVHVADSGHSAQPAGTMTPEQAAPAVVNTSPPPSASHHGVGGARSPWTWLAGAAMAAMMVLMLL